MMSDRGAPFILNDKSTLPLFHQIIRAVRDQIEADQYKAGDKLPSERELSQQLGVSRLTVRQAMRELLRAGYCYKVRGKGLFVSQRRVVIDTQYFDGFTASIRRAGLRPETRCIRKACSEPPDWVREGLDLERGEKAIEIIRLRLINSEPALVETEWFPEKRCAGLLDEDLSQSLYTTLETKFGIYIARAEDLLLAQVPVELERKLLSMPSRVPVIVRNRIAFGADNMPIEAVRTVYKPNIYEFRMHLVRGQF